MNDKERNVFVKEVQELIEKHGADPDEVIMGIALSVGGTGFIAKHPDSGVTSGLVVGAPGFVDEIKDWIMGKNPKNTEINHEVDLSGDDDNDE